MTIYQAYMAEQIAQEIKEIEDPYILSVYLKAIFFQRCKICGAKDGTCNGGIYTSYYCRQLNEMSERELKMFDDEEESK